MARYTWVWEARSKDVETQKYDLTEGEQAKIRDDLRETTENLIYSTLVRRATRSGIPLTIISCDVVVDLKKISERGQYYAIGGVSLKFITWRTEVTATTVFEADEALVESHSPFALSTAMLWTIGKVIALLIVAFGAYHLLTHIGTTKSTVSKVTEVYDKEGNLISRTTKTTTTTGTDPMFYLLIIGVVFVILAFVVGFGAMRRK